MKVEHLDSKVVHDYIDVSDFSSTSMTYLKREMRAEHKYILIDEDQSLLRAVTLSILAAVEGTHGQATASTPVREPGSNEYWVEIRITMFNQQ